jgi:cAMP phosphodiesterase
MRFPVVLLLLALLMPAAKASAEKQRPVFELSALGVLGGDADENLSCYLLARPGERPRLMIDAGSVRAGLIAAREKDGTFPPGASNTEKTRMVGEAFASLEALLITHSHLDHIAGFLLAGPALLGAPRSRSLRVIAFPETLDAIEQHVLKSPLWVDLTKIPAESPLIRLEPLKPAAHATAAGFRIEAIPLRHPVPSAAFLISSGDDAYLHLGDTGPSEDVWTRVRPLFVAHALRAIALEVSFPDGMRSLAMQSGHLTPNLLLLELNKLAQVDPTPPDAAAMTPEQTHALAARLAPAFEHTAIVAIHIKAGHYDAVTDELKAITAAGLHVRVPQQGDRIDF